MSSAAVRNLRDCHINVVVWTLEGNEFHRRGPAVVKHWSPKMSLNVEQHTSHSLCRSSGVGAFWRGKLEGQSSTRYIGALPDWHWKTSAVVLYFSLVALPYAISSSCTLCCFGKQIMMMTMMMNIDLELDSLTHAGNQRSSRSIGVMWSRL